MIVVGTWDRSPGLEGSDKVLVRLRGPTRLLGRDGLTRPSETAEYLGVEIDISRKFC